MTLKCSFQSLSCGLLTNRILDCLSLFVQHVAEAGEYLKLSVSYVFPGFERELLDVIEFKAKTWMPEDRSQYHMILYDWHIARGDYVGGKLLQIRYL